MRQFLKFVLATIVGLFMFCFLGIVFLVAIAHFSKNDKDTVVEANSVLRLDLNYPIHEKSEENPFAAWGIGAKKSKKGIGLSEIRECIRKAKTDDNIKGIYLDMGLYSNGMATN